jgi:hypothetical protein
MKKLTLIYNANSGYFNAFADSLHKTFSPKTYSCNLCALTHGFFKEKTKWKQFLNNLNLEMEFVHKNETKEKDLPKIKLNNETIVTKQELNKLKDLDELIFLLQQKFNK